MLHHGSSISNDSKVKANMFNKFFYEQFSESSTYNVNIDFSTDNDFDIDFSATRVHRLLNEINVNKASGPDDIPGIVLKNCSNHLAYPLSLVFKLIYNTGTIPSQWKLSNVVPIHKKGDDKDVTNYRPISLLCTVSKILERIMHDEIISRTLHLIDKRQHGFLPRKSCATNLLCLIDDVAQNLHKKVGTDIIYFDFAKAFDTVSHDKLLYKLKSRFNIDGRLLKFLQDYLKNRRQNVVLNNIKSQTLEVHSCVPQGPTTFCAFY